MLMRAFTPAATFPSALHAQLIMHVFNVRRFSSNDNASADSNKSKIQISNLTIDKVDKLAESKVSFQTGEFIESRFDQLIRSIDKVGSHVHNKINASDQEHRASAHELRGAILELRTSNSNLNTKVEDSAKSHRNLLLFLFCSGGSVLASMMGYLVWGLWSFLHSDDSTKQKVAEMIYKK